ncbi:pentapeptide repeats family protein [[Clostridium] sordellii ATCC 9714]|nr:pentapeptide repeats family protein [[Clostridium] sordellii ATCC 9714] [Paeniclostridium sordellii ATCC 9714]
MTIENSDFQSAVFQEVENYRLNLDFSELSKCTFSGTSLKGVDFTTCNIENCEYKVLDVAGGTFSIAQALELSKLLRITIK